MQFSVSSNGKIFCFKNKFLNFSETKKFSTQSFLTFRGLHPLVSYKQVSYKKIRVFRNSHTSKIELFVKMVNDLQPLPVTR